MTLNFKYSAHTVIILIIYRVKGGISIKKKLPQENEKMNQELFPKLSMLNMESEHLSSIGLLEKNAYPKIP